MTKKGEDMRYTMDMIETLMVASLMRGESMSAFDEDEAWPIMRLLFPHVGFGKPDGDWFNRLASRLATESDGQVRLELLQPGEHGYGGIKGPAIYARLVRAGFPNAVVHIGPYDQPLVVRR